MGVVVSNEDSGSVGLCGPETLMCREFPLRLVQLESRPHFASEGERVLMVSVSVELNSAPLDSGFLISVSLNNLTWIFPEGCKVQYF